MLVILHFNLRWFIAEQSRERIKSFCNWKFLNVVKVYYVIFMVVSLRFTDPYVHLGLQASFLHIEWFLSSSTSNTVYPRKGGRLHYRQYRVLEDVTWVCDAISKRQSTLNVFYGIDALTGVVLWCLLTLLCRDIWHTLFTL